MGMFDRLRKTATALFEPIAPTPTSATPITKQAPTASAGPRLGALAGMGRKELGSTGLQHAGGILQEEWLSALQGDRGLRTYREMMDMDPTVGAILYAIEMLIRQASWDVEPASEDQADQDNAEFLWSCMNDMDRPWTEFVAEVLTMLGYGWSIHELVYKLRRGQLAKVPSKYDDQRIGWKRLPIRGQDTLDHWELTETEDVDAFVQVHPVNFQVITIPSWKFVHFKTTGRRGSPEGRSVLRNAYRPWFFKKRLEEIEAVGIERDLAGLPVAEVPARLLSSAASANEQALLETIKKIVRSIKVDEQMGVVWPLEYDSDGNKMNELKLMASPGTRSINTGEVIQRYDVRIATCVLADFILLGHEKVGSFALNSSKTSLFATALGAWLDSIAETLNEQAVPRLFALNGLAGELPRIVHGDIETPDLKELGEYITKIAGAGALTLPDDGLERYLRRAASLPDIPEDVPDEEDLEPGLGRLGQFGLRLEPDVIEEIDEGEE